MNSQVVADSGIYIASVLNESLSVKAQQLIAEWTKTSVRIIVPVLFRYEIVAVIRKNTYRGILNAEDAVQKRELLLAVAKSFQYELDDSLLRRAHELSVQLNRSSAYDSQYLAVAERYNCEFWILDEKLYNAVHEKLTWVKWVGSLSDQ